MFLDAGYSPSLFWELSIGEISDLLESKARKHKRDIEQRKAELKEEITLLFNQALQIGNVIGKMIDGDMVVTPPKEYYPDLFKETPIFTEQEEDKPKLSPEMELHKARMDDFIFRHNMAMQEKQAKERGESSGRNDVGEAASDHRSPNKGVL